jgi:hypothetical protein
MALFITGTILFSLISLAFTLFMALWVYEDAKIKSDQPPLMWVLIVVLVNPIGIIIYLAAGRSKKEEKPPGKYKTALIVSLVAFIFATGLFTAGTINFAFGEMSAGMGAVRSGSFRMSSSSVQNNVWTFRARYANGFERRSPNLSAARLENFHVLSDSGDQVTLRLEQDNRSFMKDLSGFVDAPIDLTIAGFEPGNVRIALHFNRANDVDVRIDWRE